MIAPRDPQSNAPRPKKSPAEPPDARSAELNATMAWWWRTWQRMYPRGPARRVADDLIGIVIDRMMERRRQQGRGQR